MLTLKDRVLGCIVGGAIGDAAGSYFEGSDTIDREDWLDKPWQITDDTQLTLATCEALTGVKADAPAVAESLLRWFRARRVSRVGSSTLKALRDLNAGCHWALAGRKGDFAAGNGAAMRIAPLAFCTKPTTTEGRQLIRDVSRITHHNDEAYLGAFATVVAICLALADTELPSLHQVTAQLPDSVVRDRLKLLAGSETTMSIAEAATRTGTSGFVAESVPLAIFASQKVNEIGFKGMLGKIIKVGGDTDTIASIACQVAGTIIGFSSLPVDLLDRLPEREMIFEIASRFAEAVVRNSSIPT